MTVATLASIAMRSSMLLAAVWLLLQLFRVRDAATEKLLWTIVALASVAMLMSFGGLPLAPVHWRVLPARSPVLVKALSHVHVGSAGWQTVLLWLYGLGAMLFMARWAKGVQSAARLCREAFRAAGPWEKSLDVRVSKEIEVPASFGQTILLPDYYTSWNARTLAAVIAHERAHTRNFDCHRLWIAELYRAMFWYNPLAHCLCRRLRLLAELTSDEAALAVVADRSGYRELLLQLASRPDPARATVAMARRGTLRVRLERLCRSGVVPASLCRLERSLLVATVVLMAVAASACAVKPLVLSGVQDRAVPWVGPQARPLTRYYPVALRHQGVEGLVKVRLSIDSAGHVTRAVVLAEEPRGAGLAEAALRVAKASRFHNTLSRPVVMNIDVKFKLSKPIRGESSSDASSGGA